MEPEIVDLARTAGTTLVTLMATDTWQSARSGLTALWRRVLPARADDLAGDLDAAREELIAARRAGDEEAERELRAEWSGRVRRLLVQQPDVADELRRVLADLEPAREREDLRVRTEIRLRAEARGSGRVYQAGRDQTITER